MSHTATISSGEQPPLKKPEKEPTSNLPLPDDLMLNCVARVSKFHYPILSLVSKSFRSLISSQDLYQTRSLLHRTETCIYVCLQFPTEPNLRWFTLCRKPDKTLNEHISKKKKKKKTMESSSGNFFAPVQFLNSPTVEWSTLVSVGHKLYAISSKDAPCSSNVFFLDCRTHTWADTPNLRLAHTNSEMDGMMYLAGSSEDPDSLNCVEVFHTETQTWKPVPPEKRILKRRDFEGKIMDLDAASGMQGVAIKPKDMTEDAVGYFDICMIEKTFYFYKSNGEFHWSNRDIGFKGSRKVKGLEGLPKFARYCSVKLVACGGKMMVFWDKYVPACGGYKEKKIWCAEISLQKRSSEEIWGHVEWFDSVLTVPKFYKFVYAVAATV